jgi:hypothetical protein
MGQLLAALQALRPQLGPFCALVLLRRSDWLDLSYIQRVPSRVLIYCHLLFGCSQHDSATVAPESQPVVPVMSPQFSRNRLSEQPLLLIRYFFLLMDRLFAPSSRDIQFYPPRPFT